MGVEFTVINRTVADLNRLTCGDYSVFHQTNLIE
jgi:hypothetical protein